MSNKYVDIWLSMEPDTWHTAKELGIAPATMLAMSKRGLVALKDTSPKQYQRIKSPLLIVLYLIERHKLDMTDYIDIYCAGNKLPMLCSVKDNWVYDCWEKIYDISKATSVRIGKRWYSLSTGKTIVDYHFSHQI